MIKVITKRQIETIIDENLSEMFNKNVNVSDAEKDKIKTETLKLSQQFIDIISEFNTGVDNESFVDRVMDKIDDFMRKCKIIINSIQNKNEAGSVCVIWNSFFNQAQEELKDNIEDKKFFEYGEQELRKVITARIK